MNNQISETNKINWFVKIKNYLKIIIYFTCWFGLNSFMIPIVAMISGLGLLALLMTTNQVMLVIFIISGILSVIQTLANLPNITNSGSIEEKSKDLACKPNETFYKSIKPPLELHLEKAACQVCGERFADEQPTVVCEQCYTPHHKDCWGVTGKCSIYACGSENYAAPVHS